VLVEKFAHTRFEPSGWTGNEQIGFAKSIMDYIFRWLQLRFLSGHQLSLFQSLVAPASEPQPEAAVAPSSVEEEKPNLFQGTAAPSPSRMRGIAPEAPTPLGKAASATAGDSLGIKDRGVFHAADAMKEYLDMGDAPSCHTCGAIMVRNGSCYRCMSCGSTSGCS
jgi:ribonucleoside-diphosphate reductase alpha chain